MGEAGARREAEGGGGRGTDSMPPTSSSHSALCSLCCLTVSVRPCVRSLARSLARSVASFGGDNLPFHDFTTFVTRHLVPLRSLAVGRSRAFAGSVRAPPGSGLAAPIPSHPIPFPPSGVARSIWQSALGPTASWDNLQSRSAGGDTGDGEVKRRPQHRGITHNSGSGVRPGRTTYVVPVSSVCILLSSPLLSSPRSSSLRLSSSISSSRSVCRDKCMLKCARRARAARNAARSHSRFRFD